MVKPTRSFQPKTLPAYSLVELIVVVGLTAVLAITITSIMMTSMLSSTKIRNMAKTKQEGDQIMVFMRQFIRNARKITACTTNSITLEAQDGNTTTFSLSGNKIASTSGSNTEYLNSAYTAVTSFTIQCTPTTNPELVQIGVSLENITNTSNPRPQEQTQLNLSTSVQIRNQ